jgi:dipeptidyl-peptidase-4
MRLPASHEPLRRRPWLCVLLAGAAMTAARGDGLDIDRLFDAPALAGPALSTLRIAPGNAAVWYLRGKAGDANRLDLWEFDVAQDRSRRILDADALSPPGTAPSAEELARRERQRTASLSGILDYSFIPGRHAVLVPQGGRLYMATLHAGSPPVITALATGDAQDLTDATVSPRGDAVAYVSGQDLYLADLQGQPARRLTHDGGGAIRNGQAEFVAQEEMGRHTGYWWSPDGAHIAFAHVDESAVPLKQRFEVAADGVTTFAQRYPAAGDANARVTLGVVAAAGGAITWIDPGADDDAYIARVQWLPDGRTLAIQRESRDQHTLELRFADIVTGHSRRVLVETAASWIELNDELTFLHHSGEFLWASCRDGYQHLYLYRSDGTLVRRLTAGAWNVGDFRGRAIKGIDEKRRLVYFTANERSPLDRDLYVTSLDTPHPAEVRRITQEPGLHAVTLAHDLSFYVDRYTSRAQPPQVGVRRPDGSLRAWIEENPLDARHPDAPYLAGNALEEFGSLRASDGQELFYRLFRPRTLEPGRRYPAIVQVYGGPGVQAVLDDWGGDEFTQILTRAGYVVFQLDNRGSAFRGTAFQAPLSGRLGGVEVEDQVQGARWLATQPYVDPQRIGVWGWSYGGFMTLMLMFRAPEVFRAGVAGAPVTDWSLYDSHYTERFLGTPQDHGEAYAASSVLGYAGGLEGRLLLIHGMADDNVLFSHSTMLMSRLQELGKPFDLMVYPGEKHALLRQPVGRHALRTILGFFGERLGPQAR